jgi:RNA polymerase sigma-70 factor (ECF subfamily)
VLWHPGVLPSPDDTRIHADGPSDEELVAAFVRGDERAFSALVSRYERRVAGICLRYFRDPQDAQDAAQEAFLTLYRRAGTFKGTAAFSTWMYRVTTNACNDLARKRGRRPRKAEQVVEDLPVADPRDHHGQAVLRLELRAALDRLEPDQRDAVVAHTVRGEPYHEIAERTGVAVGTIKSRVHRGHARLAALLSEDAPSARAAEEAVERSGRPPPPT